MNLERALKLSVDALAEQIQELEVSANLYAAYRGTYPSGEKAYRRREQLRQAVQVIQDEINRRQHEVS